MELARQWDKDGFGQAHVEIWSMGVPDTGFGVEGYAQGANQPCFEDDQNWTIFNAYEAVVDNIFLIDREGRVQKNLVTFPLTDQDNQARLDGWVRDVLETR